MDNVSVYTADVKGKHKGVLGLWRLSRELKTLGIDAIADLHNVLRSKVLKVFLSKPCIQIDKGRAEKKALISGEKFEPLKTTHQRYVEVFEKLGYTIDLSKPSFPKSRQLNDKIKTVVGTKQTKWIGIAPFAAHESKMYPLPQMKQVIESLSKDHEIFLFGGGAEEITILKEIEALNKGVINLAGQLSMDEELDLISNLDVMLSMDSGNAHIAAMLGVKVITIWGVTHPYAGFVPFNQPKDHALVADRNKFSMIPTSVYGNKYPENYKDCAGSTSVETVVNKVQSVL